MGTSICLLLATSAVSAACLLVFASPEKLRRSIGYHFAMGVALQFLLSLPAGVYQGMALVDSSKPLPARLAMAGIGAPYNTGGWTVRTVFESTVSPPPENSKGQVPPKALVKFPSYLMLLMVQGFAAAYGFAAVVQKRRRFSDPLVWTLGAFLLINSLAGANWAWWK